MPVDVSSLHIVTHPAAVLRAKAKPLDKLSPRPSPAEVRAVALRMIQLMREAEGIGLAAPQVGLSWRLFVVDVPPPPPPPPSPKDAKESKDSKPPKSKAPSSLPPSPSPPLSPSLLPVSSDGPQFYINPVLSAPTGAPVPWEEGCLSLPDIRGDVLRPPVITISALDLKGEPFTQTAAGLLARCWQHEMDHLDGVLIIDRMTQISRIKNRSALRDLES